MRKFVNHIDHVAWVSRLENLDANVAELERLSDTKLARFVREDMGIVICVNWAAGLEVLAPTDRRTEANQPMHDWLETKGEGVMFVVFGVDSMEKHKARLEALGVDVGPLVDDDPASPWHDQLVLRERIAGTPMGSVFVLGDIDYAEGLIDFREA
jgi:hypothetical protein